MKDNKPVLYNFSTNYNCNNLDTDKTCFKNPENPTCINLSITNSVMCFQNTTTVATGLFDLYKIIVTACETSFKKSKPKEIIDWNYMKFDTRGIKTKTSIYG